MCINGSEITETENKIYKTNILVFIIGRFVSELGSAIFKFALSLYILDITGSSVAFSAVLGFSILPGVFVYMFAGVFVDKYDKKKIIVACDILSGIIVLMFLLVLKINSTNIIIFIIYSIILSVVQALFNLALNASIPSLVKSEDVPALNSSYQSIGAMINILGPILGALAYVAIGLELILLIDGITFILSGILELVLKFKGTAGVESSMSYFEGIKDVFIYLKNEAAIKYLLIILLIINFVYSPIIAVVLPYTIYTKLKLSVQQYGMIEAAWFVGVILGSVIVSVKKVNNYVNNKIFIMIQLQAACLILWFFPKVVGDTKWLLTAIFILLLGIMGIFNMMSNVPMISHLQLFSPENLRGRIYGVVTSACSAAVPFGVWIYGVTLKYVDWAIITSVTGVAILIIGAIANRQNSLKEFFSKNYVDKGNLPEGSSSSIPME